MSRNSPSRDRLGLLSYKLETRDPLVKTDKSNKVDTIEERCHQLQEKMSNYLETNNKEIKTIKEQIVKVKDMLAQEKASREALLQSRYRDIAAIENRIAHLVENEMQAKQESDYKLTNLINHRNNELKEYLRKETAIREENINLLNATLEADLPKLSESIKTEQSEQADADAEILKKCHEQVHALKEFVNKERKERADSERTIQEMLKNVFAKVKEDIELERKNREATEESLMTLLEETCKKVADAGHQ